MCDGLGLSSLEYGAVHVSGRCGRSYVLCVQERLYGEDVNCGGCVGRKKQRGGGACERTLTC